MAFNNCPKHKNRFLLPRGKGLWEVPHFGCDYPTGGCDCYCGVDCEVKYTYLARIDCVFGRYSLVVGDITVATETDICRQMGYPERWTEKMLREAARKINARANNDEAASRQPHSPVRASR